MTSVSCLPMTLAVFRHSVPVMGMGKSSKQELRAQLGDFRILRRGNLHHPLPGAAFLVAAAVEGVDGDAALPSRLHGIMEVHGALGEGLDGSVRSCAYNTPQRKGRSSSMASKGSARTNAFPAYVASRV